MHAKNTEGIKGHRWAKGQSGNPGGRPKGSDGLRELARSHTREAVEALIKAVREGGKDRVRAAEALLDRGWGKAPATFAGEGGEGEAGLIVTIRDLAREAK